MRTACTRAGRTPLEVDYIEAHATGTVVGDRIEGSAITEAFGGFDREVPLRIASVKSNVGHMEAAAFHCALLKVLLMMQRRTFAPISQELPGAEPGDRLRELPHARFRPSARPFPDRPVTFGINSFGFGGANGHCVVREYRPSQATDLVGAAGTGGRIHDSPVGAYVRRAGDPERAGVAAGAWARETLDLYTLAGNLSRRRTHFATRTDLCDSQPGGADR